LRATGRPCQSPVFLLEDLTGPETAHRDCTRADSQGIIISTLVMD
jgi:hypothetical protein